MEGTCNPNEIDTYMLYNADAIKSDHLVTVSLVYVGSFLGSF